ncbi:MAG: hypothetical protein JSS90_03275 [Bacteroidetes bacterium]|nr:hypothetical protein [Bacteroidota bacterium]
MLRKTHSLYIMPSLVCKNIFLFFGAWPAVTPLSIQTFPTALQDPGV